jgi:hypothetical protein
MADQNAYDWFPEEGEPFLIEVTFKKGERTNENARELIHRLNLPRSNPNAPELSPGIEAIKFYRKDITIEKLKQDMKDSIDHFAILAKENIDKLY